MVKKPELSDLIDHDGLIRVGSAFGERTYDRIMNYLHYDPWAGQGQSKITYEKLLELYDSAVKHPWFPQHGCSPFGEKSLLALETYLFEKRLIEKKLCQERLSKKNPPEK